MYLKTECPALDSGISLDSRYELVDSESFNSFYSENGILTLLSSLPLYEAPADSENISIYSQEYYGLEISCRQNLITEIENQFMTNLSLFDEYVEPAINLIKACMIVGSLSLVIFFAFL